MGIELRAAWPADAEAIARLARACLPEAWSAASFRAALERPRVTAVVAERGPDELAGFGLAAQAEEDSEILSIAVAEGLRGVGLGRRMLESLLERLRAGGAQRVHLEVRGSN